VKDSQEASKILVDYALQHNSQDNLSCMVVRFDANLIRDVIDRRSAPIGVEGDPSSKQKGGVSEADKILERVKKNLDNVDDSSQIELGLNAKLKDELIEEAIAESPGPELHLGDQVSVPNPDKSAAADYDAMDQD
jgi:protein phosphatase PTC1